MRDQNRLAGILTAEQGKPLGEARDEIAYAPAIHGFPVGQCQACAGSHATNQIGIGDKGCAERDKVSHSLAESCLGTVKVIAPACDQRSIKSITEMRCNPFVRFRRLFGAADWLENMQIGDLACVSVVKVSTGVLSACPSSEVLEQSTA